MHDIIRAALDEFLIRGYEGTSMDAIANRAKVSKGGLYHHFRNKDEILLFVNQKLDEPIADIRRRAAQKNSAVEGLIWYTENYLKYWEQHEKEVVFYSLSMAKILDSHALWDMYKAYSDEVVAFLRELFQRGIDGGEFRDHSASESAISLMAALDGIIFYLIIDKKLKRDDVVAIFRAKFIDGMLDRKSKQSETI